MEVAGCCLLGGRPGQPSTAGEQQRRVASAVAVVVVVLVAIWWHHMRLSTKVVPLLPTLTLTRWLRYVVFSQPLASSPSSLKGTG